MTRWPTNAPARKRKTAVFGTGEGHGMRQENVAMGKMPSRGTEGGTRYSALLGRHGRCQVLHALLGNHQNGSESTASAAVSIASCTGLPTTGTTDATAPPTRIGTSPLWLRNTPTAQPTASGV